MKTPKIVFLALLMLSLAGARADSPPTDVNPALFYYRAFLMAPVLTQDDSDYLFNNKWQGQQLPKRFGDLVAKYDNEFKLARAAAKQKTPCDWGIDASQGPATQLPHLARAKAMVQMARLRVLWDLQQDNQAAAREDLLAAFVLGRNVARDGTLLGMLVQRAVEAMEYWFVAENFGRFSPETLRQLVDGFDAAPPRATAANAMRMEKLLAADWIADRIHKLQRENPGNDAKVMEAIRHDADLRGFEFFGENGEGDTNVWPLIEVAAGGTSEGILGFVRDLDPLYPRLTKIMTLPPQEYEKQAQKFDAEIQKSPNPLARVIFPSPLAPRRQEFKIQTEEAMLRAAIAYKLRGEAGLNSVKDPFGTGPFELQRFEFEGVDRGFELTSTYNILGTPCSYIFVEKEGPRFMVSGPFIGQAAEK